MPTAAETKAANTDYTLPIADALNIHTAIHAPGSFFVKLSNGISLPIVVSANGSRRVDLIVDHKRPKGRAKFMAQNTTKDSAAARLSLIHI